MDITSGAVSQRWISRASKLLAAGHQARVCDTLKRQNAVPYFAPYHGHKVHLDQKEKTGQDYACTYDLLSDTWPRLIAGCASIPAENPILI